MIEIPSGNYKIGNNSSNMGLYSDNEGPVTSVHLEQFYIDPYTVTNFEFKKFVEDTGYITEAEREGWSFVFHYFLSDKVKKMSQVVEGLKWWYAVPKANWKFPEGEGSSIVDRMNHPVVHISIMDAINYCKWQNKRLPTEAEWEVAAKGGTNYERYPWGETFLLNNKFNCNIWEGGFPYENTGEDGYYSTAPVDAYVPNDYGIYQMIGNVWEWCINPARISLQSFNEKNYKMFEDEFINDEAVEYALRGGSFLCHHTYCKRYRISARNGQFAKSTSNNIGFRCVSNTNI